MGEMSDHMRNRALRDLGQPYDESKICPTEWRPIKPRNPSKRGEFVFADGEWRFTHYVRFVNG